MTSAEALLRRPRRARPRDRPLYEYWPRCPRDPRAAALDSSLAERQIAVYASVLVLGQSQGHFTLQDPPRQLAANFVAMEDGFQMEIRSELLRTG